MTSLDELLALSRRYRPLERALSEGNESQRVQCLLSIAGSTYTEQQQRFLLGLLKSLSLDEESEEVNHHMTLIMWLLGDVTEESRARKVFALLSDKLPTILREQLVTSFS